MNPLIAFSGLVAWQAGSGLVAAVTQPLTNAAQAGVNVAVPITLPSPDMMVSAYLTGHQPFNMMLDQLRLHGIRARIRQDALKDVLPSPNGLRPNGGYLNSTADIWGRVIQNQLYVPSIHETLMLFNRGLLTNETATMWIQRQVSNNRDTANAWLQMRYEIPGPSDLIRFAVREAFTPDIVRRFGYHKEFPQAIVPWMEKQGYGQNTRIPIPDGGTNDDDSPRTGNATWSDLYWWAHWDLPSLSQGYEMLHRLYPTSDYGPSPDVVGDNTFQESDLDVLQKAQDVPTYWRRRLQAISYHPINKVDLQHLFANQMITEAAYYHNLRKAGYSDRDSKQLLDLAKLERDRNLSVEPSKITQEWICSIYESGIVDDETAQGYLVSNGFTQTQAEAFISKCFLQLRTKTAKIQLAQVKRAFMNGVMNETDLLVELGRIMTNQNVKLEIRNQWRYLKAMKWKFPSARQALTYYKNGIIPVAELTARLQNLEYTAAAINRMIQNANLEIAQKQARALQMQIKRQLQEQKAATALAAKAAKDKQRLAERQSRIVTNKAQKRLRGFIRASSDANIKGWYKDKLIELWEVYYRLYYKDYSILDAERWIEHNFKETTKEERNVASKKAQSQYVREGNPPFIGV